MRSPNQLFIQFTEPLLNTGLQNQVLNAPIKKLLRKSHLGSLVWPRLPPSTPLHPPPMRTMNPVQLRMRSSMILSIPLVPKIHLYVLPLLVYPYADYFMQVSISSTTMTSATSITSSTSRPGVRSLPPHIQRSFSEDFIPCVITEIGCSASPWLNLDVDTIQDYVNIVYTGYDYAVEHGDGFHSSVRLHTLIFYEALTSFKDQ